MWGRGDYPRYPPRDFYSELYDRDEEYYDRNGCSFLYGIWNPFTYFGYNQNRYPIGDFSDPYRDPYWDDFDWKFWSWFGFVNPYDQCSTCFDAHFRGGSQLYDWRKYAFPIYFCAVTVFAIAIIILCGSPRPTSRF